MLAKKTVKNKITLPKSLVERLPKTDYFEVSLRGDEILLKPVLIESRGTKLDRIRKKIKALGLTEKDVDAAIRWARTRECALCWMPTPSYPLFYSPSPYTSQLAARMKVRRTLRSLGEGGWKGFGEFRKDTSELCSEELHSPASPPTSFRCGKRA
jgi:hypothetical protein